MLGSRLGSRRPVVTLLGACFRYDTFSPVDVDDHVDDHSCDDRFYSLLEERGERLMCLVSKDDLPTNAEELMEGRQYTDLRWIACKSRRFQVITDDGLAPNLRDPVVRDFFRDIIFLNCHEIGLIPHQVGTVRIMSVLKEMFSRYLDCPITTEFMKRYEAEINAQNRGPSTSNQEQDSNEILSGESRANYLNKLSNWISTRSELNVGQMSWDTAALLNGDNLSENSMPADCHEEKTTDQGLGKWLSDTGTAAATAVNDTLKNNTWRNEMIEIIRPVSNAIGAAWLWLNEDV